MMALLVQQAEFRLGNQAPNCMHHFHGLAADANVCKHVHINWLLPIHQGKCSSFFGSQIFSSFSKNTKGLFFLQQITALYRRSWHFGREILSFWITLEAYISFQDQRSFSQPPGERLSNESHQRILGTRFPLQLSTHSLEKLSVQNSFLAGQSRG